ncbi:helix-turn-helix domain-containing protein [Arachnia rubra]|uniref:Winged helix-turn-helix domain-containing protein n=1 Tax=Arachnia rubra TaxID=1547448 RepID=A0ABX7Y4Z3_9ACTN|nr:winged helix-turn-helix domain-containing protein [Arachnia rubra]QUC07813.1 winged helix-turn-helix domain-containing protein [Arachnia rubra]BCR82141.1 hypothetical protein SK1NUM_25840 [Arachnia rubra]
MKTVEISPEEFRILQDYKHEGPHKLMKGKAEAILLLSRNVDIGVVAELAERTTATIKTWLQDWHETRLASIHTGHAGNLNASKLTPQQRAETIEVLQQPPGQLGLPAEFWTVPDLANWIDSHFQITYASETSYHFLLHLAGLSFHKPGAVDQHRAPEAEWSARRFVDSGEKPEFIRTCEVKSVLCRLRNLVKSLKNKSSRRFLRGLGR